MSHKKLGYQELIMKGYILIVGIIFVLSIISYAVEPFDVFLITYDKYSIKSVTLLIFSASILTIMHFCKYVPPLQRILCSLSLPVLGISFYESLWHLGYRMVWGGGFVEFWSLYSLSIALGTYILHTKYKILKISETRINMVCICLIIGIASWALIVKGGFYQNLLAYENGLGVNPHTPTLYLIVSLIRISWIFLVNGDEKNE